MITQRELENLERNFKANTRYILTPKAHDIWVPTILELIEQARNEQIAALAADGYDVGCTCGVGGGPSPEHAAECPRFIPF